MALDPTLITNAMQGWQAPQSFDPLSQIAKIQALKNGFVQSQVQQQALQSGALELQERQKAIQEQDALNAVFKSAYMTDPNTGAVTLDENKLYPGLAQAGLGAKIPGIQTAITASKKNAVEFQKADTDAKTAKANYLGQEVLDIADSGYDPGTFTAKIASAVQHGALTQADAAQALRQFQQNPTTDGVKAIVGPMLSHSPVVQDLLDKRKTAQAAADRGTAAIQGADLAKEKERVVKVTTALQAAAAAQTPDQLEAARSAAIAAKATPDELKRIPMALDTAAQAALRRSLLTAEQQTTADQAALNAKNTEADRKVTQAQNAKRIAFEQQNASINAKKFAMEFGGDAVKGWAKQVQDNPDTANTVPPPLRTAVMQAFTANTGLPYPKPLTGTAVDQERASRNALDAVAQVKAALADPAIQSRIGPILGRLGSAEQTAGTAIGLTPEQEAKAQQLRTNMRYLVFQEGKALMGGRMPAQLMTQLEQSSPNVAMDAGTLNGALAGVTDAAGRNLDQTFKQRYGENAARPKPAAAAPAAVPADVKAALANQPPGVHKLSDGSKWMKAADGSITPQ
ncbi:MAG TPA: hypothetical protein VGR63_02535 [Casimicrobiaceae bacterium]|jgi:hypothetical protein|nr:hypothetical protein [Casimicrobiaceae bacterium]